MSRQPKERTTFTQYIADCRKNLQERRMLLNGDTSESIIDINSPFELRPATPTRLKYGVLLIHGLYDCPFSMREIAQHLEAQGMLCRAILLPGHGTVPDDLLTVSYEDWIKAVGYGIATLRDEVENIILLGYSTGATLSVYHTLKDRGIAGIVMLAPLIRIRAPGIHTLLDSANFTDWFNNHLQWLVKFDEKDYAKYLSITSNSVSQVTRLANLVYEMQQTQDIPCPVFMTLSSDDRVISSREAIHLFLQHPHPQSRLVVYSTDEKPYSDPRVDARTSAFPELKIRNFSHISLPFSPRNPHYGQQGDYVDASRPTKKDVVYGSFNGLETQVFDLLNTIRVTKTRYRELTYNPDFDYMVQRIAEFILKI